MRKLAKEETINVEAVLVADNIALRNLDRHSMIASSPLALRLGDGVVVVFRYGALVFFNAPDEEKARFIDSLRPDMKNPHAKPARDAVDIHVSKKVDEGAVIANHLHLRDVTLEKLCLVAEVLARDVVLDHYERGVAADFDRVEPLAASLAQFGRLPLEDQNLKRHLGSNLLFLHNTIGRAEVIDKPAALWDLPELDRTFARLEDEYELRERYFALERKIQVISQTAQTLLGLTQSRHATRLEWYVIILIAVEIFLNVYDIFLKKLWFAPH